MENEFRPSMTQRFGSFLVQCKRVWQILRKPSNDEFKMTSKVAALGILAIGLIGFVIADVIRIMFK